MQLKPKSTFIRMIVNTAIPATNPIPGKAQKLAATNPAPAKAARSIKNAAVGNKDALMPDKQDKPQEQAARQTKQPKATHTRYDSLGSIRDYFTVQLEQDASWDRYHPNA